MTMREINTKSPPARVLVRERVSNADSVFNKLVPKKHLVFVSGDLENPDLDDYDPWDAIEVPND